MPDSDFTTLKRNSYAAKRAASQGAGITLCNVSGAYCADFECAQKCKEILGPEIHGIPGYSEHGYPGYRIPIYEAYSTIQKLSHHCSVALIEHAPGQTGTRAVSFGVQGGEEGCCETNGVGEP